MEDWKGRNREPKRIPKILISRESVRRYREEQGEQMQAGEREDRRKNRVQLQVLMPGDDG